MARAATKGQAVRTIKNVTANRMGRKVAAVAAASVFVLAASACGSDDDTDDPLDDPTDVTIMEETPTDTMMEETPVETMMVEPVPT